MTHPRHPRPAFTLVERPAVSRGKRVAFTLVELLVVIGIIALLISILLPALNRARGAAQTAQCLSNLRQMSMATIMFAQDHKGNVPTVTSDPWVNPQATGPTPMAGARLDTYMQRFAYRSDGTGKIALKDWMSALIPYMGGSQDATFLTPGKWSRVFRCPSDIWLDEDPAGYRLFNNVNNAAGTTYFPVSYGANADIASVLDSRGVARFDNSGIVGVVFGPTNATYGNPNVGGSVDCKIAKVRHPAEVLLYGDCGTRPNVKTGAPLDYNDALYYTTNYMSSGSSPQSEWGKLSGVALTDWLKDRIPFGRHNPKGKQQSTAKINVGFVDGHGETVLRSDFNRVRISPWMK